MLKFKRFVFEKLEIMNIDTNKIELITTKNFNDFKEIIEELTYHLGEHLEEAIKEYCGIIPKTETDDEVPYWQLYVVKYEGIAAGITGLYILSPFDNVFWLSFFGVLPKFWGSSLGKNILEISINKAKKLGGDYLYLYTDPIINIMGVKLYKKLGFEIVSTVEEFSKENNLDSKLFEKPTEIIMRKKL